MGSPTRPCENNSQSRNNDRETHRGAFCAFWSRESPVVTPGASTQVIPAGNAPCITLVSCSNGRHHGLDAEDVERPSQIVDERREAELGAHIFEALHQKGALVHPYVDGPLLASCWAVL